METYEQWGNPLTNVLRVSLQVHLPQWLMACLFYNIKDIVSLHLWIRVIMLNYGL
jgi:hypothetical protein